MTATSGKRARVVAAALAFAAFALVAPARAGEPSAENIATARELYRAGADALDAGDAKTAAEKLAAAWALAQTPVIGADLARAQLALGRLVEAREAALAVGRLPLAAGETSRSADARAAAAKLAAHIAPRIPHVTFTLKGVAPDRATVKLDGVVVPSAALGVARQTNPGLHRATLDTDDGRHADAQVTVGEAESKTLTLEVAPPAPVAAPAPPPSPVAGAAPAPPRAPGAAAPTTESSRTSPLVWVGVTTAGVGAIVGSVAGLIALNDAARVKAGCNTADPSGTFVCGSAYTGDLSSASTLATASTIAFGVALAGAGLAVTGFVIGGKSKGNASVAVVPMVGPVSGLSGRF